MWKDKLHSIRRKERQREMDERRVLYLEQESTIQCGEDVEG
jgi:hypothetical protein